MSERTNSKIFGIIGESLSHTLSPQIHNHFFEKLGLDCFYCAFEIKSENLKGAILGIKVLGISGVNVTFPYKEEVIPYLDELDLNAQRIGAVNTIKNTKSKLIGYNTDVVGIRLTLEHRLKLKLKGKNVFLLGAGGAARACLWELLKRKPERILVLNRTFENAEKMVAGFSDLSQETEIKLWPLDHIDDLDFKEKLTLLINATSTPVSLMEKIIRILSKKKFFRGAKIFDLNYNQRSPSCKMVAGDIQYVDGLYMLSSQAAESFHIWTKIKLNPEEVFRYIRIKGR
ncbi:MAG: shikimate dehydrogenase [Candidatus Zixiibacteriota bacterium]